MSEHKHPIVFRSGKRIYLRPVIEEDIPLLAVWINDPEVTQFLAAFHPYSIADEQAWVKQMSANHGKQEVLGIVLKESHQLIGVLDLRQIDFRNGIATMGFSIGDKDCWDQGYGTEAQMVLLEYAFNTLNLRKVCADVYDNNPRSKRCMEKCGYREEGRLKKHLFKNGKYIDVFQMAVFREGFLKLWKRFAAKA